ncbi:hypothetical protein PYW07_013109 [Mythimna separata]|uniref:Serine protease snake-like n=1 Tax=Mythimna separata TaxID=271217 RepID=A0AAD7Y5R9_MYTSE|nr:hypothetical protein PYW07_013109 [Mythimna separata]
MFSDRVFYLFVCVISVQCAFDRSEGEPCQLNEQTWGKCAHISRCLSSLLDLQKRTHPVICSFQSREPVVCCPDCEVVNDTRTAIVSNDGAVFFRTGQKARDKCIEHLLDLPSSCYTKGLEGLWDDSKQCQKYKRKGNIASSVAVGGKDAERSRYPHMALLGYGYDRDSAQWQCGGSLISKRFVLSAAHCISDTVLGPVSFVALGILKRTDPDSLWQTYDVQRIISHPEYRPPSKYHDIALLETVQPVRYSKDVFPACLDVQGFIDLNPKSDDEDKPFSFEQILLDLEREETTEDQSRATATGWGRLGKNKPLADNLQEVKLQKFTDEKCSKLFPPHRLLKNGYNPNWQMCYGDENEPRDTCEGDSGGPLLVTAQVSYCLHTIIGVTSYGKACGYLGDAGMYTRVYHYVPWIESVVWPGPY